MTPLTREEIAGAVLQLPPLPNLVMDLINALDHGDIDTNTLSQKILHDQALTAKVLGLANSSFYGMQSKIASIPNAIAVIGFNSVRMLVTAAAVINTFSGDKSSGFSYLQFWKHAIGTALCARNIARHLHSNQDHAFIAGLLHNIGRVVLALYSPQRYGEVLHWCAEHDEDLSHAELHVLGMSHQTAGRTILEYWKFPASIIETLTPPEQVAETEINRTAAIVNVADAIAYGLDLSTGQFDLVPEINEAVWQSLQLDDPALFEIFDETEIQFKETAMILTTSVD